MRDEGSDPGTGRPPHAVGRVCRGAGLAVSALLAVSGPLSAAPIAFDCDLAIRRIDGLAGDFERDVQQYEALKATLAVPRQGMMVSAREAAETAATRRLAAYIEKIAPDKFEDIQRKAQQAHARDCIPGDRLQAILNRAKADIDRVVTPPTRP